MLISHRDGLNTAQHPHTRRVTRIRAAELQDGTPGIRGADVAQDLAELGHLPALGHQRGARDRAPRSARCHPIRGWRFSIARGVPDCRRRRRLARALGMVGIILTLLVSTQPADAVLGVGDIVSDPGAYSYFVEQIKAANNQITELRKQVETLGGIKTVMSDIKYSAEGVYGRGVGIIGAIQDVADNATDFGTSIKKAGDFSDFSKDKFNKRASPYREVNVRIDGVWKDPRSRDYSFWKDKDKRYNAQQQIYKDNLTEAEVTLTKLPDRLVELKKLSDEIDKTKGLKDAADLQNRFLAEILVTQQQALKMLSHIAQALAAAKYQGVQPEEAKKAADAAEQPAKPRNEIHERAVELGVDGISDEERIRRLTNRKF